MIDRTLHPYLSNFVLLSDMKDPLQKHIEKLKIMKESAKDVMNCIQILLNWMTKIQRVL
jgi:hypothetical protein